MNVNFGPNALVIEEQPAKVHASHPLRNERNHEKLLAYLVDRINFGVEAQKPLRERYEAIDNMLCAFVKYSADDQKRLRKQMMGEKITPVQENLQFVLDHLQRGVTYLLSVFAPDSNLYRAVTTPDKQPIANAFAKFMTEDGRRWSLFSEYAVSFMDSLKYNLGGMMVEWSSISGQDITTSAGGAPQATPTIFWQGNKVRALDMYNQFWDPSVRPQEVYNRGEFCGYVRMITRYELARMAQDGEIFNVQGIGAHSANVNPKWYQRPPRFRLRYDSGMLSDGQVDWNYILTAGRTTTGVGESYELSNIYVRLVPAEFGLAPDKKLQTWRITLVNGQRIVAAQYMNNFHGFLPQVYFSTVLDNLGLQQKSIGEKLLPFQALASFIFNIYVKKKIRDTWGRKFFDPNKIDMAAVGDDVAYNIPVNNLGRDQNVNNYVAELVQRTQADDQLQELDHILAIMEFIYPTKLLQQVADMERAVKDQVAALLQAGNRESWKYARLIDEQGMSPLRFMMIQNIKQFGDEVEFVTPKGIVKFSPTQFRDAKIEYGIGEGLKSLDRLVATSIHKELLGMVAQSPAINGIDTLKWLTHISQLSGDETDMEQFKLQGPPPAAPGTEVTPSEAARDVATAAAPTLADQQAAGTA